MSIGLIILAIFPGLAISAFIIYKDKHEREPHKYLILSFLYGCFSTLPAIFLEETGQEMGIVESPNIFMTALFAFGVVGFSEELVKFVFLRNFMYKQKAFNEPFDGIVYSVMIGMGFATVENILYAMHFGLETTIVRMFTAVPAHAVFGIVMGYYVGYAKFDVKSKERLNLYKGFGLAIFLHGAYDFFLFQQNFEALTLLAFVTLALGIHYSRQMIKIHQENSPFVEESVESDHLIEDDDIFAGN